jgi:hypothetical protein
MPRAESGRVLVERGAYLVSFWEWEKRRVEKLLDIGDSGGLGRLLRVAIDFGVLREGFSALEEGNFGKIRHRF